MTTMQTIARAAMGAATRIYSDELDEIIDRHFPGHSVKVSDLEYVVDGGLTPDKPFAVRSQVDGWRHECNTYVQARDIAAIMNRNGR